jgi:glycosyltransferase involved in cell wall biosynthesis
LTPVYNAADYIGEAIKSVANSDFLDYEHIVVDDGSTDSSRQLIEDTVRALDKQAASKVKIYSKPNSGEADTDNFALSKSSGEYIVVLNADDIVGPSLLRRSIEEMDKNPEIVVTYPDWTKIDGSGDYLEHVKTRDFSIETLIGEFECLPGPGACIRRSAIEFDILRDPQYPLVSDYECWQKLSLRGPFLRIPEPHAFWRIHGQNLSVTSRGAIWADQAILVSKNFLLNAAVARDSRLRRLAKLGLSRAYLVAALQGAWDARVPIFHYLTRYFVLGLRGGRVLSIKDFPILAQIVYSRGISRLRASPTSKTANQ